MLIGFFFLDRLGRGAVLPDEDLPEIFRFSLLVEISVFFATAVLFVLECKWMEEVPICSFEPLGKVAVPRMVFPSSRVPLELSRAVTLSPRFLFVSICA